MKIHRFYIQNITRDLKVGDIYIIDDMRISHQCINVLRLEIGEYISLFHDTVEYLTEIIDINNDKRHRTIQVSVREIRANVTSEGVTEARVPSVNLYMSYIKKSNFELVLEKAVELGVNNVVGIQSTRTERANVLACTSESFTERAKMIIVEATEQCGRMKLMRHTPSPLTPLQVLERGTIPDYAKATAGKNNGVNIFAHIGAMKGVYETLEKIKAKQKGLPLEINLYVGPEGGWTDDEASAMLASGYIPVSLGRHILRAETAAIVMCGAAGSAHLCL